jgi:serine/threonine protein kinase
MQVMHRDLKPQNILIDDNLFLKIVSLAIIQYNLIFRLTLVMQRGSYQVKLFKEQV